MTELNSIGPRPLHFPAVLTLYPLSTMASCYALGIQSMAAEPIGPGGPRPAHFLALVGRLLWPAHFFG